MRVLRSLDPLRHMTKPSTVQRRILVVDDDPLVCDSIKWLLTIDGDQVDTACSGQAALARFQRGKFDAIIVDYEMPGMYGDELAAAIKSLDPQQPILLVSGYPEALLSSGRPLTGVDLVIGKPFSLEQLRQALITVISKRRSLPPGVSPPPPSQNHLTNGPA